MDNSTFASELFIRREPQPGDPVLESVDPRTLTHEQLLGLVEAADIAIVRRNSDGGLSLVCSEALEPWPAWAQPEPVASPSANPPPGAAGQPGAAMLSEEIADLLGQTHVIDWATFWPALLADLEQQLGRPLYEAERAEILAGDMEVTWHPAGVLRGMGGLPDATWRGGGSVTIGFSPGRHGGSG